MRSSSLIKYLPFLALLLFLLTLGGGAVYGMVFLQRALTEKMRAIQEFVVAEEYRQKQLARLPELEAQYQAILSEEKKIDTILTEGEMVDFVKTLESLARATDVRLSISTREGNAGKAPTAKKPPVKPNPETENPSPGANPNESSKAAKQTPSLLESLPYASYLFLTLKISGSYQSLRAFLERVETLPYALDVVALEIKPRPREEEGDVRAPASSERGVLNPFAVSGEPPVFAQEGVDPLQFDGLEATLELVVYIQKTSL